MTAATVVIVPGLRDELELHWQTLLEQRLRADGRAVASVRPMGRVDLSCAARVAALERAAQAIEGPIVVVAHSGGCITVAHWAQSTQRAVHGALFAAPPDFERPLPGGYPRLAQLDAAGWLPVPRRPLPFRCIVGASRNDPLAAFARVAELAEAWGATLLDLGPVGHLNPASGHGEWPLAETLIDHLAALPQPA
jgi:uncharacterized protein